MERIPKRISELLVCLLVCSLNTGCGSARQVHYLPYQFPLASTTGSSAPQSVAILSSVIDSRSDHTLDMFLKEYPAEFFAKAMTSELLARGVFARIVPADDAESSPVWRIYADLREVSWAIPNKEGIARTQFGVTLATGLAGGLVYGATQTPVYSRVITHVRIESALSGRVVLDETFEILHQEKLAKLKLDSLGERSRIIANALKENIEAIADKAKLAVIPQSN